MVKLHFSCHLSSHTALAVSVGAVGIAIARKAVEITQKLLHI